MVISPPHHSVMPEYAIELTMHIALTNVLMAFTVRLCLAENKSAECMHSALKK